MSDFHGAAGHSIAMQCGAVRGDAMQGNAGRCGAQQCDITARVRLKAGRCDAMRGGAGQCYAGRSNATSRHGF